MQKPPPLLPTKVPMRLQLAASLTFAIVATFLAAHPAHAATDALSAGDQAFVAKVSQGGMFEVASSKVAVDKAQAQNIKDMANTEVHDHELVGAKLKTIANQHGDDFPTALNADFSQRIDKLNALSGQAFDHAYSMEMKRIHALDGAAFVKEAKTGQNTDLKAFAAETSGIVEMHIGAWHAVK